MSGVSGQDADMLASRRVPMAALDELARREQCQHRAAEIGRTETFPLWAAREYLRGIVSRRLRAWRDIRSAINYFGQQIQKQTFAGSPLYRCDNAGGGVPRFEYAIAPAHLDRFVAAGVVCLRATQDADIRISRLTLVRPRRLKV